MPLEAPDQYYKRVNSFGKKCQVLAEADDLIKLIGCKVIVGKNITT